MAKTKTTHTAASVTDFVEALENDQKKTDSYKLIELMSQVSGCEATMWGPTIVGFGNYHYKYDSGHEGDAPVLGFSPRKAAISLYVFTGLEEHEHLLSGLGKYSMGKACIYAKKLADINTEHLTTLMQETIKYVENKYQRTS
ncbi:DUF1801 domain-containing protein [Dyadobacter luteus]|uniref:DUF1801 domain-containing protein n=1 Tax=Dyadobacter luteus TaxID=2259619 RepID=A0A3D8YAV7_9BACT|nr:DUF1801 domain-containing protein [Dyadobacter luteus]REA60889.1 DUF1801 domain-containing protein [Dyadobacter luteus]